MDTSGLPQFIEAGKREGASDQILVELLRQQGWPDKDIYAAFGQYLERRTGMVLPARTASREGAKDAFLYLLSFSTLGTWTVAVGSLWFGLIDIAFPDVLYPGYQDNLAQPFSTNLAAALIGFPIYLFAMRLIGRDLAGQPEKLDSPIRKWLTYIALLIAAGIVIGDLITFLSYFFRGELSIRFVLKVLAVLVISGGVLWYYLGALKSGAGATSPRTVRNFTAAATAMVTAAVVLGFFQLGLPATQREIEADVQRSQDLERIAQRLHARWTANGQAASRLPPSLSGLGTRIQDPVTNLPYRYSILDQSRYQLCANFAAARNAEVTPRPNQFLVHPKGTYCFTLDAALPPF